MPELAEVEFNRKIWNLGLSHKVVAVELHSHVRIFRGIDPAELVSRIRGSRLLSSVARGKQMLFRFSNDNSLGIHLGMTGSLRVEPPAFESDKHDHLVLRQIRQALVFRDPRQFGRVRFYHGKSSPPWWSAAPEVTSGLFTKAYFVAYLLRHSRAPIKAVLLMQTGFPGIGNWMADEILWRAKVAPAKRTGQLTAAQTTALFRATRFVSREALRHIGHDDSDLPRGWLIHQRWKQGGLCPRHGLPLTRATIGGRTTAWCSRCQRSDAVNARKRGGKR